MHKIYNNVYIYNVFLSENLNEINFFFKNNEICQGNCQFLSKSGDI